MLVNRPPESTTTTDSVGLRGVAALLFVLAIFVVSFVSIYQSWINNTASILNNSLEIAAIFFSLYFVVIFINRN